MMIKGITSPGQVAQLVRAWAWYTKVAGSISSMEGTPTNEYINEVEQQINLSLSLSPSNQLKNKTTIKDNQKMSLPIHIM